MRVIDSAEATAAEAARLLNLSSPTQVGAPDPSHLGTGDSESPQIQCFATDSVEKFERLGSRFLGRPTGNVELVDLGG